MALTTVTYTKQTLIQRIRKHMNNSFISDDYTISDGEIMLYIDQAVAFAIIGKAMDGMKVTGVMDVPEAFLVTYQITTAQDPISGYWKATLSQPPLSLPLGYSITRVYAQASAYGPLVDFLPIRARRVPFRVFLPTPPGGRYWVENFTIWLAASNNSSLMGYNFYVQMPVSRTTDITLPMNLPDDIIQMIFDNVCDELAKRNKEPRDIIKDNIGAGSNNVNTPGT